MPVRPTNAFYVTGTDTGIGKTRVAVAMLHHLRARGLRAVGMKPVASGCERTAQGWRNEDALRLQAASEPRPDYDDLNPYALIDATAPQLAARRMGIQIALPPLVAAYGRLAASADAIVVEGVGGWAAPAGDALEQAEIARALGLSAILVVGLRLGCLSHARLSARAIAADGVPLAGWIANRIDPSFADAEDYLALLRQAMPAPCLGALPFDANADIALMSRTLTLPEC